MNPKKLVVAGGVFFVSKAVTDEIAKNMNLSGGAKQFVGWGVGVMVSAIAHRLV